jgi:formylmethanofuran dehydrogenase subunit E
MYLEYRDEYIKEINPVCFKCGKPAEGDFYDKDWNTHPICKQCYEEEIRL